MQPTAGAAHTAIACRTTKEASHRIEVGILQVLLGFIPSQMSVEDVCLMTAWLRRCCRAALAVRPQHAGG